ncbi:hypothetical protein JGS22_009515 [Streptomyces sp. P38-E01]|uniref:Uncharacterized protein n=1 Tax=Streptomyces tardus TaxID=2780544 RepID=A0A949JKF6_9ACTN|nr:hypothetical protein [Streptomyces tardus]MBU7597849.1 hypothetical protein [Streptomyces tardus]
MSETIVNPPTTPQNAAMALPDVSAFQQAVVETFFGIIGAPDDPDALAGGARALAELDALLDAAPAPTPASAGAASAGTVGAGS